MSITFGSDCSGIEAAYIAVKNIYSGEVIHKFSSDNNVHVRNMIKANFDPEIIYNDVFNRPIDDMPEVDIYMSSPPCQSFSSLGLGHGFRDTRGTVFLETLKYIKTKRPKTFIIENVMKFRSHDKGRTFRTVMDILNNLGIYHIDSSILTPHRHANHPQMRHRLFIVGIRKDVLTGEFRFPDEETLSKKASELLNHHADQESYVAKFESEFLKQHEANHEKRLDEDYYFIDLGASVRFAKPKLEVVPCLTASRSEYYVTKLGRKLVLEEIERIQGIPKLKVVVSRKQYLKQLGNSICVPLMEKLMRSILEACDFGRADLSSLKIPASETIDDDEIMDDEEIIDE